MPIEYTPRPARRHTRTGPLEREEVQALRKQIAQGLVSHYGLTIQQAAQVMGVTRTALGFWGVRYRLTV